MIHGHGDDQHLYANISLDFSSNINPYGISDSLKSHLVENLQKANHYPEPMAQKLARLIELHKSLISNSVLVCNGSVEAIYLIAQQFSNRKSLIFQPTFLEYEDACLQHRHAIEYQEFDQFQNTNFNEYDLIWICNPNNPSGGIINRKKLLKSIVAHPKSIFIIDEAYVDFVHEKLSMENDIAKFENLIVLKSLTKSYAIPGIRLGYMIASPAIIANIEKQLMPWRINQLAIEAGFHCFYNPASSTLNKSELLNESKRFQQEINQIKGFKVIPSSSAFFLIECPCNASVLKEYLIKKHGILIRDASNFRGLGMQHIRVATQLKKENNQLIEALQQWR